MTRERDLQNFLVAAGWADAPARPLAGDASSRRYLRLVDPAGNRGRILMDAPVERCGTLQPFVTATEYLERAGLSVPRIFAADYRHGFLLLEDFGDALVSRMVGEQPELETEIYAAAIDLLVSLRGQRPDAGFPHYSPERQSELAALAIEWYRFGADGGNPETRLVNEFRQIVGELVCGLTGKQVFVHRDYHAENLIWLPERDGIRRLGLLDYQDGAIGHPAYDLVSVLEDARRDIPDDLRLAMIARYAQASGQPEEQLLRELAICGAQRNLRIIGVFARLALRDGKPGYLDYLPRVWRGLARDLSHPATARLARFVEQNLPPPDPGPLARIRDMSR